MDVDLTTTRFIDLARQVEAFFIQQRFLLSALKPQLVLKEENQDLRLEINRKDEVIKKHYDRIELYKSMLSDSPAQPPPPPQQSVAQTAMMPPQQQPQQQQQAPSQAQLLPPPPPPPAAPMANQMPMNPAMMPSPQMPMSMPVNVPRMSMQVNAIDPFVYST